MVFCSQVTPPKHPSEPSSEANSQLGLPQPLKTHSQHQMQCATEPGTHHSPSTPTLDSSAPTIRADAGRQQSPQSSHVLQPYAVLSRLRHLAASSKNEKIFEQQTRRLIRENAPSPEPRPNHSSPEPQDVDAETGSPVLTAPTGVADQPESASSHLDRRLGPDAQLQPETLADPVEKTPISDCIIELTSHEEQDNEVPVRVYACVPNFYTYLRTKSDSNVDDQLQPQCEDPRTEAKGKGRAVEVDSDNESISSDDDHVFDGVGDGDDSLWGGDSDVSEERAVPPPARPPKRSVTGSDDDDEAPAAKRHKSSSRALSEDDDIIVIDSSDDDMPSYVRPMNEPGPLKSRPPPSASTTQKHSQKEEDAAVKIWERRLKHLWEKRKEMNEQVSNI